MSTTGNTSPGAKGDWDTLVSEGRELAATLSQNKWKLGDLALRVEPIGERGGEPTGVEDRLRHFADLIGVGYNSLREYRAVSDAWPSNARRLAFPWSVHQALRSLEDRAEVIGSRDSWTVREARELAAERRAKQREPAAPHGVQIPRKGTDATYSVTWTSVYAVLRRHLSDDPGLLNAVRRDLLAVFDGGAS
jgi:hypothetical protein